MWIFNEDGFFSVVRNKDNQSQVLIRARKDEDLTRLLARVERTDDSEDVVGRWTDEASDYHYRLVIADTLFLRYLATTVVQMDYTTSIKDHIDQGDQARHDALMGVWTEMARIQPKAPWSGKPAWSPGEQECLDMIDSEYADVDRFSWEDEQK